MNDQQLEAVLRRSLARHADTVDSGPTWPPADDVLPGWRDRHRPPASRWVVAAAVAAVLAVIGIVVAVRHAGSDHSRPAAPHTITRTACAIDPPPSWQDAVRAGTLPPDLGGVLLGSDLDGDVLVQGPHRITLIQPDGSTRPIANRPYGSVGAFAAIDRQWIVLPLLVGKPPQHSAKLELIDRTTLRSRDIGVVTVPPAADPLPLRVALSGAHVYWLAATQPAGTHTLRDYDIRSDTTRLVTDSAQDLVSSPTGLAWADASHQLHVLAGTAPNQVPGVPGTHPGLVSDGRSYAWLGGTGITWHDTATGQTVVVQGFPGLGLQTKVLAVAGPYVLIEAGNGGAATWLIDTRTGAAASVAVGQNVATSHNGILAFTSADTVILHTDRLPSFYC